MRIFPSGFCKKAQKIKQENALAELRNWFRLIFFQANEPQSWLSFTPPPERWKGLEIVIKTWKNTWKKAFNVWAFAIDDAPPDIKTDPEMIDAAKQVFLCALRDDDAKLKYYEFVHDIENSCLMKDRDCKRAFAHMRIDALEWLEIQRDHREDLR